MALSPQERGAMGARKRWGGEQNGERGEGEIPRYRITAVCYLDDRIYDPEEQPKDDNGDPKPLYYETDTEYPAWYMEPVNDAARAMCAKHPPRPQGSTVESMTPLPSDAPLA